MSADNGIYVLETEGPEYRVIECTCIDDIYMDLEAPKGSAEAYRSNNPDVWIRNARERFKNCTVFKDRSGAYNFAHDWELRFYDEGRFLEYGVSTIRISRKFSEVKTYRVETFIGSPPRIYIRSKDMNFNIFRDLLRAAGKSWTEGEFEVFEFMSERYIPRAEDILKGALFQKA